MSAPVLSVVVPARDASFALPRCLAAIGRSARADVEVIVVDDGSVDDTGAIAEQFGATLIRLDESGGPARARNVGWRAAKGQVVMFVDADVEVAPGAVSRVLAAFDADVELSAMFGSYDDEPRGTLVADYRNLLHHFVHQQSNTASASFWAGLGAVRRSALLSVGGFDEAFRRPSIEDIDLGARLAAAGHRIRLDKQLQGKHLKCWTLLQVVRTDVLDRALPWSRTILRRGALPRDLNLRRHHRLSAFLVWLGVGHFAAIPAPVSSSVRLWLASIAVCSVFVAIVANLRFYRFLAARRGVRFACAAIPLHLLYYAYASATFAWCSIEHVAERLLKPRDSG